MKSLFRGSGPSQPLLFCHPFFQYLLRSFSISQKVVKHNKGVHTSYIDLEGLLHKPHSSGIIYRPLAITEDTKVSFHYHYMYINDSASKTKKGEMKSNSAPRFQWICICWFLDQYLYLPRWLSLFCGSLYTFNLSKHLIVSLFSEVA